MKKNLNYIKSYLEYHKIFFITALLTVILLLTGILVFMFSSQKSNITSFQDKDISKLNVPQYILTASDTKIELVETQTKKIQDTITFTSPILAASDKYKQYLIVYDVKAKALYEVYTVKDTKKDTIKLQKEIVEDNISDKILAVAASKYHYGYATKEKVWIKNYDSHSVVRTIDLTDVTSLKLHNGLFFAANQKDFAVSSIQISEPKIYKNFKTTSAHINDDGIIILNNYGQQNNFSLLIQMDSFGKVQRVSQLDSNKVQLLDSEPNDLLYLLQTINKNQMLMSGESNHLKSTPFQPNITQGTVSNDIIYTLKDGLILIYQGQPYYKINMDIKAFALIFHNYDISPRQQQILIGLENTQSNDNKGGR